MSQSYCNFSPGICYSSSSAEQTSAIAAAVQMILPAPINVPSVNASQIVDA